jgi:hypothetical protein
MTDLLVVVVEIFTLETAVCEKKNPALVRDGVW